MKKSSMRRSKVSMGQIDSAERGVEECPERAANACAALVGDVGVEMPEPGVFAFCCSSRRLRLIASACRFGGPRRLLGRSNVHGISRAAHALHGGPVSSHYGGFQLGHGVQCSRRVLCMLCTYLDFPDRARIACLPETISLLRLLGSRCLRRRLRESRRARRVARHGSRLLELMGDMRDVVSRLVVGMVLQVVREALDVLAGGTVVASAGQSLDLGIYGLVQAAELQLVLLGGIKHLLCAGLR